MELFDADLWGAFHYTPKYLATVDPRRFDDHLTEQARSVVEDPDDAEEIDRVKDRLRSAPGM